jgi:hypothetical protein
MLFYRAGLLLRAWLHPFPRPLLVPRSHPLPAPSPFPPPTQARFRAAVSQALEVTQKVLGTARTFTLPEDQAHTYQEFVF